MSAPAKEAPKNPHADPMAELAERIFVALAGRIYGNLAGGDVKKPDPKALAAYSYKLAEAFEQASKETTRAMASIDAANKAKVRLDEVDLSSVFAANKPQ
jgi:hypothetical protein